MVTESSGHPARQVGRDGSHVMDKFQRSGLSRIVMADTLKAGQNLHLLPVNQGLYPVPSCLQCLGLRERTAYQGRTVGIGGGTSSMRQVG